MKKIYIYTLSKDNQVYYVGRTKDTNQRTRTHRKKDGLLFNGGVLEVIDVVNHNEMTFWEQHYIYLYRSWGFNLANKTEYEHYKNHGSWFIGKESVRKGTKNSDNMNKKISKSLIGNTRAKGKKHKVESWNKGKPWTEARRLAQKNNKTS